jgi:L-ascorbate metabolism protein UlaG (beta-lactamase superfamily)
VYFPGDTGFGPHFARVGEQFGPVRLALLPIGAFLPRWFMKAVHISPEEALRAHSALRASTSVAIHFGTFPLGDDGREEAPNRLLEAIDSSPAPRPRFWVLGFGEGREVPPVADESG